MASDVKKATTPPPWTLPPDLATIVAEDGEWEDPSWDPLLLTVVGQTRFEDRLIPVAWQLSFWPGDAFFQRRGAPPGALPGEGEGLAWSRWLRAALAARAPHLGRRLHDESEAATCVLWVESEEDGRALMEAAWLFLQEGD